MKHDNESLARRGRAVFTPNYQSAALVIERGEGAYVYDVEGNRYLDMVGGIAVSVLGHGHPRLVDAIRAQAGRVLHTSNLYFNRPSIELAERLVALSGLQRVFFCNSGAEANEAAIKLARRYAHDRGELERRKIVAFERSFHGRTYGALAATGQSAYWRGFDPMPQDFVHVPFDGGPGALEAVVDASCAAVIVEPIQGEGGVRVPAPGFLAELRRLCDARGALLVLDEVQVGIGRTGDRFAFEHEGVRPDILSLAKGLGGGLPIGAIVTSEPVGNALTPGTHGSTFGGNPVACAAAMAVLQTLDEPGFLDRVRSVGDSLRRALSGLTLSDGTRVFSEVRGRGLLLGAELRQEVPFGAQQVVDVCRKEGLLVHVAGARVVRLAPPLTIGRDEVEQAATVMQRALAQLVPRDTAV